MKLKRLILFSIVSTLCFGLFTSATSVSATATSGWLLDENNSITTNEDGYFVYTLNEEDIDENGEITIDGDALADYMSYMMRTKKNRITHVPVKIVNNTGYKVTYKDYEFDTVNQIEANTPFIPDMNSATLEDGSGYGWGQAWRDPYEMLVGNKISDVTLNATGFDGLPVRSVIAPLRCINPAIISLYKKTSAPNISLIEMNNLEEKIKEKNTFKNSKGVDITLEADSTRTYGQFLKAYYGVNSLDELSIVEKTNILGSGSSGSVNGADGQSTIMNYKGNRGGTDDFYIPANALSDGSLKYFQTWGVARVFSGSGKFTPTDYPYTKTYNLLESDPEVLAMGYEYLYDRCMRITFDNVQYPISVTGVENYEAPAIGLKKYIDKTDTSTTAIEQAFMKDTWIEDGDTLTIDTLDIGMDLPNAFNSFRYVDFGFSITVKSNKEIVEPTPEPDPEPNKPDPIPEPEPEPTPEPTPQPQPEVDPVPEPEKPAPIPEPEKEIEVETEKPNIKPQTPTNKEKQTANKPSTIAPQTGDNNNRLLFYAIGLLGIEVVYIIISKRKHS